MGHDFIAVSHVEHCELPNNAVPYAECMYRTDDATYYECARNNSCSYYKPNNNSNTSHWSINIGNASDLRDALRNQDIDISELFTVPSHTAASLAVIQAGLRRANSAVLDNHMATNLRQLIRIIGIACEEGILLSV